MCIYWKPLVTARKQSLRRLCFHRCLSVCQGASAPLHARVHTPWADTPWADTPWADTPLGRYSPGRHPPVQCMLGYGQQAGGKHPTGMHSCFVDAKPVVKSSHIALRNPAAPKCNVTYD